MHAWARWTILVVVLALSASVAAPARAAFGECADPDYRAAFDARLRAIEYDCVERLRVSAAGRDIRVIHDLNADWIVSDSEMAEFDRGVRAAADAIGRLGGVAMDDVTILLADDLPPLDPATGGVSSVAAYTEMQRDDECRIIVYLAGPGSLPENAAFVIAHELFHCVQTANLSPAQMNSGSEGAGGGGDWWLEGSANWFAALALPDPGPLPAFVDEFDAQSPTTPLNHMAYGAAVFFLWLGQESDPAAVMGFLRGMASGRSDAAQRGAMSSALSQERWLDFAQAYLDSDIRHPHGTALGLAPEDGDHWQWSATRTQEISLEPFVLRRGVAAFECGRWSTGVRPENKHRARPLDGGGWGQLPEQINTTSGENGAFRFAAINAGSSTATMSVRGTMNAGCGACLGVVETDSCLVGTWELVSGGAAEWMRNQGVQGEFQTTNQNMTLFADGTYVTGAVGLNYRVRNPDGSRADGSGGAQAGGRWSASGVALNMCADMQALSGSVTMTTRRGDSGTMSIGPAPPIAMQLRYTCNDSSLHTVTDIPGGPPMESLYTRASPPPPRE